MLCIYIFYFKFNILNVFQLYRIGNFANFSVSPYRYRVRYRSFVDENYSLYWLLFYNACKYHMWSIK